MTDLQTATIHYYDLQTVLNAVVHQTFCAGFAESGT